MMSHESLPPSLPNEAQLIQKLYASVVDKKGFHPFLAEFANSVNAFSGNLCAVNRRTVDLEYAWFSSDDEEGINAYMDTYLTGNMIEHDVVLNLAVRQYPSDCQTGLGALESLKQLDGVKRWEDSYRLFTQALGVMDTVWAVVHANEESVFLLTLNRTPEQGAYSEQELEPVRRLIPHMRQAYKLYHEVSRTKLQADSMSAVLDALARPIILLSETCEIMHCNQLARELLESNEVIAEEGRRLKLPDSAQNNELMAKILDVVRSSMGITPYEAETQYVKRRGSPDLVLCITPIEDLEQGGGAMVSVLDPQRRDFPDAESIGRYFSLSRAEARLCEDLVMGASLKEIAQRRHRSEATLRSTLKSIYEKTGLNRQGLLVSAILSALID